MFDAFMISALCFIFCLFAASIPFCLIFAKIKIEVLEYDVKHNTNHNIRIIDIISYICILISAIFLYNFIW